MSLYCTAKSVSRAHQSISQILLMHIPCRLLITIHPYVIGNYFGRKDEIKIIIKSLNTQQTNIMLNKV